MIYTPNKLNKHSKRAKTSSLALFSHFSAKSLTTVLSTPTETFHENHRGFPETSITSFGGSPIPSFFSVCQLVDRFIDKLKGVSMTLL